MNTKEKLVLLLRENTDRYLSGEAMAKELGISRTAVWKAINSLRREGFEIASSTNKGYRISRDSGALTPEGIGRYLPEKHPEIYVYGTIGSTNTKARELAQCGARKEQLLPRRTRQTDADVWEEISFPRRYRTLHEHSAATRYERGSLYSDNNGGGGRRLPAR